MLKKGAWISKNRGEYESNGHSGKGNVVKSSKAVLGGSGFVGGPSMVDFFWGIIAPTRPLLPYW